MRGEQQEIKKAAATVGATVKGKEEPPFKAIMDRVSKEGKAPKDVLGLTDAMIEGIYGQAYRLYNTGKYQDASRIFRLLLMINASEPKYAMGFAACFHMAKEYKAAVDAYMLAANLDPGNPIPFFHASDCYIQLKDPVSATVALQMVVKRSGDKPEYKTIKDRAVMSIEGLKKEIAQLTKL